MNIIEEYLAKHRDMWLSISYQIFKNNKAVNSEDLYIMKERIVNSYGDDDLWENCYACELALGISYSPCCEDCLLATGGYHCREWYVNFYSFSWHEQVFLSAKCALINSVNFYGDFVNYFINRISEENKFYISSYVDVFESLCEQWFPYFALRPEDILRLNKLKN